MSRVNITITARDLTGRDLDRVRGSFNRLGEDVNRLGGERTRENMQRLRESINRMGTDLAHLHGRIPSDEWERMTRAMREADNQMRRSHGIPMSNQSLGELRTTLRGVANDLNRLGGSQGVRIPVRPDVDRNRFTSALKRALMAPMRMIGGMLSDGVGQGIAAGFHNAGPAVAVGVAVLIASAAALIGAGLAGAIVLAFGAAFVGIGGFIASKSKVVKSAWTNMVQDVKDAWASAGQAMEPVITHGIKLLGDLSDAFLPHFKEAMRESAGPLNTFLDSVANGIKIFGKKAFHPLMTGFATLLEAFGPQFEILMSGMGDAFGALGRTVSTHSGEIAIALRMIFGLITTIIDIINFLAVTWIEGMRTMTAGVGGLVKYGILPMVDVIMGAFSGILTGAAKAFGWIPGLGDKLKTATKNFDDYKTDIKKKLSDMGDAGLNWGRDMDKANRKRTLKVDIMKWTEDLAQAKRDLKNTLTTKQKAKLRADIKQWTKDLASAKKQLQNTTKTKAKAKLEADIKDLNSKITRARRLLADQSRRKSKSAIKGDISDLTRKLALARGKLAAMNGKTATAYMITVLRTRDERASKKFAKGGVVGMATGGISRASAASRQILVGEQGPELVNLPPGSQVKTAGGTRMAMSRLNQGGGGVATLEFKSSGRRADDLLLELMREAIHQRGGDPVRVLGGKG